MFSYTTALRSCLDIYRRGNRQGDLLSCCNHYPLRVNLKPLAALLGMPAVVAGRAQADKVTRLKRKLRIRVKVLDVVHGCRLSEPAVSLAVHTQVSVAPEHSSPHGLPAACLAELLLGHAAHHL